MTNDRQIKAVAEAIASVLIPDGVCNIEEGRKIRKVAQAAIAAYEASMWFPMEPLPREGMDVLCLVERMYESGRIQHDQVVAKWHEESNNFLDWGGEPLNFRLGKDIFTVLRWAYLPKLPEDLRK